MKREEKKEGEKKEGEEKKGGEKREEITYQVENYIPSSYTPSRKIVGIGNVIGGASAASEATLSSCQSRFAIFVGIVRACNQCLGRSTVRVLTFHAKGPGFDPW